MHTDSLRHIYLFVHLHICTRIHTYMHIFTHILHALICLCTLMDVYKYALEQLCIRFHACISTHMYT